MGLSVCQAMRSPGFVDYVSLPAGDDEDFDDDLAEELFFGFASGVTWTTQLMERITMTFLPVFICRASVLAVPGLWLV